MSRELFQEVSKLRRYKRRIKRSYKQLQTAYNELNRLFTARLSGELLDAVTYAKEAAQTRRRKCALEAGLRNILQIKDIDTIKRRIVDLLNNDLPEEIPQKTEKSNVTELHVPNTSPTAEAPEGYTPTPRPAA